MDESRFLDLISGRRQGLGATTLRGLLRMLSWGYQPAIVFRNKLFDWRLRKTHRATVPVISIGNLTTGGTGKTPLVAYVANWFVEHGRRPALISRGYHAMDDVVNDEKLMLDQLCPGVPHIQNPDRVTAAHQAIEQEDAQVLVLDDGFQHRRLERDCDLVLIDATNPWGYGALLPRGLLREPIRGLHRGDLVVLTRVDQVSSEALKQLRSQLKGLIPGREWTEVIYPPVRLRNHAGKTRSLSDLKNQPIGAFCGIGNPAGFWATLAAEGWQVKWTHPYPDHHHYTEKDCWWLGEEARQRELQALVCTQKDLVKIPHTELNGCPLWAVEIGAKLQAGEELLEQKLKEILQLGSSEGSSI